MFAKVCVAVQFVIQEFVELMFNLKVNFLATSSSHSLPEPIKDSKRNHWMIWITKGTHKSFSFFWTISRRLCNVWRNASCWLWVFKNHHKWENWLWCAIQNCNHFRTHDVFPFSCIVSTILTLERSKFIPYFVMRFISKFVTNSDWIIFEIPTEILPKISQHI